MREILAREGLVEVERVRRQANAGAAAQISRASIARTAGLNDATLVRGLKGVSPRLSTVEDAAAGLLTRIIETSDGDSTSMSTSTFQKLVEDAAGELAFCLGEHITGTAEAAAGDPALIAALQRLDEVLVNLNVDHHRMANALRHVTHAWLRGDPRAGVKLALVGAAVTVLTARRMPGEADHAAA